MSTPAAQQLPHQPSVLLDAVLNINLLLLQGNTPLSPPALAAAPAPAPARLTGPWGLFSGAVCKSSGQCSPPARGALGEAVRSTLTQGRESPHLMSVHWDGLVGDGCRRRSFCGEHAPSRPPKSFGCPLPAPAVVNSQGHELGAPVRAPLPPSPLPAWAEAWWPPCPRAAAGQRPFPIPLAASPSPVTCWRPETARKGRKLGETASVPLPALPLTLETGYD